MSRIRSIKPEFWTDEKIVECSRDARLLFIGIWNFADDEGRLEDAPKQIKLRVFPADAETDVARWLDELSAKGLIVRYVVDGKRYLQITGWTKHQRISNPAKSKFPSPPESSRALAIPREEERALRPDGKGREGIGEETADATREKIRDRWAFKQLVLKAIGALDDPNCRIDASRVDAWIDGGADPERDILPTVERLMAKRGSQGPPASLRYFDQAIADAIKTRTQPLPEGKHDASRSLQRDRDITGHGSRFAAWSAAAREPAGGADGPPVDHDRAA